jgi:hypothetical protein
LGRSTLAAAPAAGGRVIVEFVIFVIFVFFVFFVFFVLM